RGGGRGPGVARQLAADAVYANPRVRPHFWPFGRRTHLNADHHVQADSVTDSCASECRSLRRHWHCYWSVGLHLRTIPGPESRRINIPRGGLPPPPPIPAPTPPPLPP